MKGDYANRRGASMIDRELQERGSKRGAQGSDLGSGQPDGPARAVGGLFHAVKERTISVGEAATGIPAGKHWVICPGRIGGDVSVRRRA